MLLGSGSGVSGREASAECGDGAKRLSGKGKSLLPVPSGVVSSGESSRDDTKSISNKLNWLAGRATLAGMAGGVPGCGGKCGVLRDRWGKSLKERPEPAELTTASSEIFRREGIGMPTPDNRR